MGIISSILRWATGTGDAKVDVLPVTLGPEADIPDPDSTLTPRQIAYIKTTWCLVKPDIKSHGINFFILLFETHPHLQTRFKAFRNKPLEELVSSRRLTAHGTIVMTALDSYVENLEDVSTVVEMLKIAGDNHKARGVKKGDFEELAPVLIRYLRESLGTSWSEEAENAWKHLLVVVNSIITSSF